MKKTLVLSLLLNCWAIVCAGAEEIIQKITLEPENSAHLVKNDGYWHIPVEYGRDAEGRIVMEAERPAVFVSGKKKDGQSNFGEDKNAGDGKYVMRMQRGAYVFQVPRRRTYRVWYRASFPVAGNWFHTETMDNNGNIHTNYDYDSASPKTVKNWVWVKGTVYDLAAGSHILELDWQGGALLDQIVLIPDDHPAPQGGALTAYTLRRKGEKYIPLKPLRLQDDESLQSIDWQGISGNGKAELFYSADGGESYSRLSGNKLPAGSSIQLMVKVAPDNGSYPQLAPMTAITARRISEETAANAVLELCRKWCKPLPVSFEESDGYMFTMFDNDGGTTVHLLAEKYDTDIDHHLDEIRFHRSRVNFVNKADPAGVTRTLRGTAKIPPRVFLPLNSEPAEVTFEQGRFTVTLPEKCAYVLLRFEK